MTEPVLHRSSGDGPGGPDVEPSERGSTQGPPPSESAMTFGALAKNVLWRKSIDCLGGEAGTRAVK